jgi:hypothetical protein
MAYLFGRTYTRSQLLSYVGEFSQIAGTTIGELGDGSERGTRFIEMRSGSGLRCTILPDRGLDISAAEYRGIPLAWISPVGFGGRAYFEPQGLGWLYGFGGGLMTGCGLTHAGAPDVDNGEELGLHGRLSFLPARKVNRGETWHGDECTIWVEGEIRQARVHGENLLLQRRISTELGRNIIRYDDVVENLSSYPSPLMMLYHINIGFPMLNENCYLSAANHKVSCRDAEAEKGIDNWSHFQTPTPQFKEQVFYHDLPADSDGYAQITLVNPILKLKLTVRYLKASLFNLVQWKMMGQSQYVLGLEPANCFVEGRSKDRARGVLKELKPGEKETFAVEIILEEEK